MNQQSTPKYNTVKDQAKEKTKEKMFDALLEYAAACHVDNIIEESKIIDQDPSPTPSPEFERKMKKLIKDHERKEKIKHLKNKTVRYLPKAAIFFFVLIGSLSLAITSIDALRVKVLNIIVEIQDQYTSIRMEDEDVLSDASQSGNQIPPPDWNGYVPNYIPEGFQIVNTEEDPVGYIIHYTDAEGKFIRFNQIIRTNTDLRIDTENANVQQITIKGNEALFVEKQGLINIVWEEEYLFYIVGEAEKDEMIKKIHIGLIPTISIDYLKLDLVFLQFRMTIRIGMIPTQYLQQQLLIMTR